MQDVAMFVVEAFIALVALMVIGLLVDAPEAWVSYTSRREAEKRRNG